MLEKLPFFNKSPEIKELFFFWSRSNSSFRAPPPPGRPGVMHHSTSAPDGFGFVRRSHSSAFDNNNGSNKDQGHHQPVVRVVKIERTEETVTNNVKSTDGLQEPTATRVPLVQNGGPSSPFQRPSFPLPSTIQENIPLDTHRNQCYKKVSLALHARASIELPLPI